MNKFLITSIPISCLLCFFCYHFVQIVPFLPNFSAGCGAVLQAPSALIYLISQSSFSSKPLIHHYIQTVRPGELKLLRECSPPTMCAMSCVRCHISGLTCQVSHVRCIVCSLFCSFLFRIKWWS